MLLALFGPSSCRSFCYRTVRNPGTGSPRQFSFRYRSATHFVDVFRTWYGPVNKAFAAQTPDKAEALAGELAELLESLNRAGPGSLVVPSEYLEVVVSRA